MESITDSYGAGTPPALLCPPIAGRLNPLPGSIRPDRVSTKDRPRPRRRPSRRLCRFWAAQSTSTIGSQFTAVALPLLAAFSLGASPMAFGVLAAAAGLPHLLFGLFAGAWVDRLRRRPVMIAAESPGRSCSSRSLWPLARGVADRAVGGDRFSGRIVHGLLRHRLSDLYPVSGLSRRTRRGQQPAGSNRVRRAGDRPRVRRDPGPHPRRATGAAGRCALLHRLSHTHLAHPRPRSAPERTGAAISLRAEIGQGLRAVWQSPVLRALALSSTVMNVAGFLFLSIYVLYMTRDLGLGAEAVGLVFAAGGVGALLGSVSAGPARGRWGVGRVLLGSQILFGLFGMLVPLAVLFPDAALPLGCGGGIPAVGHGPHLLGQRGQSAPGDHAQSCAGPGERDDAFHRLGIASDWVAARWISREPDRAARDLGRRRVRDARRFVPLLTSPIPRLRHLTEE